MAAQTTRMFEGRDILWVMLKAWQLCAKRNVAEVRVATYCCLDNKCTNFVSFVVSERDLCDKIEGRNIQEAETTRGALQRPTLYQHPLIPYMFIITRGTPLYTNNIESIFTTSTLPQNETVSF